VLLDAAAGLHADESLDRRARRLSGPDRALCHEIAFGALRWKLLLDSRLDALLSRGLGSLPPPARAVLEVAAYQLLFLDRVPAYAVLDRAVENVRDLLPASQARGLAPVVNATLRALAAEPRAGAVAPATIPSETLVKRRRRPSPTADTGGAEALAVATSHPAWLVARWMERFGPARARAMLEADNMRPGVHLRPHAARVTAEDLARRLRAEGADIRQHALHPNCLVLGGGDPRALAAYREGLFSMQDVSGQLVSALAAELATGLTVDLCAAPGGKVGAVAEQPGSRTILAVDVSARRLTRLLENARRQSLPLLPVVADARELELRRPADFVLADVPCLGTGTLRRRVDARWRKSPASLPELTALQRGILGHAADLLAPGGGLLYATCSVEREENEDAVAWILAARQDLRQVDLAPHLEAAFRLRADGASPAMLFLTPELGDCDGAFAALLEKVA
jgi:16S rRNA (cytosine967-C5)-methyltransferase